MSLELKIGLDAITSYRRLAYTPWHAIAEFVDNSTQAYFDHRAELDDAFKREGTRLTVGIVYDEKKGILRVSDNAVGMSYEELEHAMHIALPPNNTSGRSKYGMGLKTAACWIGNHWVVRTKRLGETIEHKVVVDVPTIASGNGDLEYTTISGVPSDQHYTVIEITDHNRRFQGRTLGKISQFLRSMYREDLRKGILDLEWQGHSLTWTDQPLLVARDGSHYRKDFDFDVDGKRVWGWVGVLADGSRAEAGFSILHCGRVVRGWPDSWRPTTLYGQIQGSNDLINQRLVGEIHLDGFEVSHTKDDILWLGDQQDRVEDILLEHCKDYREIARTPKKNRSDERGPSEVETRVAVEELKKELESPEMVDAITIETVPPEAVVEQTLKSLAEAVAKRVETFRAVIPGVFPSGGDSQGVLVKGYLAGDLSPNDPYVVVESPQAEVLIIVNTNHPHWHQLSGSEGVLNYLRHCTYDAIAEWIARHKVGRLDPNTIKMLKDKLLRIPFHIEMHAADADDAVQAAAY